MKALNTLRWSYVAVFSTLAVLVLFSQIFLYQWLKAEERVTQIVNMAGRQRTLSERILWLSLHPENPTRLRKATLRFKYVQEYLFEGDDRIVKVAPPELVQAFNALIEDAERVLAGGAASPDMIRWQRKYFVYMDRVVDSIGDSSLSAVQGLRRNAMAMATTLLVVIILQAFLIFRPLLGRIESATSQILQTNDELNRINLELEQFQFAASHDLSEPLRTTQIYLQLFEEQTEGKLDEESLSLLHEILAANGRMKSMLEGLEWLLPRERQEAETCSGQAAVKDAVANLSSSLNSSGAKLVLEIEDFQVKCHRSLLVRMFQNLISNAVKYSGDKRAEILVQARVEGKNVSICVNDRGVGIAPQHLDKVFEPFRRLHRHDQVAGSGLGLTFCRDLVRRMGGEIRVESSPEMGTSFQIRMPVE